MALRQTAQQAFKSLPFIYSTPLPPDLQKHMFEQVLFNIFKKSLWFPFSSHNVFLSNWEALKNDSVSNVGLSVLPLWH